MADRVVPGPVNDNDCIKQAVCVSTRKIMDACRDKDCIEDLRVYPTVSSLPYIESAFSVRPKCAQLLHCEVTVNEICLNRGYYTVDVTYFYKISGETFPANQCFTGLAVFDKRVMLFGSEGSVKSFSSDSAVPLAMAGDLPTAVVNSVDPICLHCKLVDSECLLPTDIEQRRIPEFISAALVLTDTARRWFVTIGQFSIIRLERDTQLLIPAYDYCMPDKECPGVASDEDPCMLFSRIRFPVEEFFPPDSVCECDDYRTIASKKK